MNPSNTDIKAGLTSEQVAQLPKNIPAHHVSNFELALTTLKNQIVSFFFILLVVSGILSLFLHEPIDATIFFAIAGINALIGFFQEFRASKSALLLEKMISHEIEVRRDGVLKKIPSTDVVLGDIVLCEPGDVIVADMLVREAKDVFLDESVLTGETLPRQIKEGEIISSGSNIVQGCMVGQVTAVGKQSSLLLYAEKISQVKKNSSFDQFIDKVSQYIIILTVMCLMLVFVMNVLITHQLIVSEYILFAISMLVGVVPESLPLIVTLILTREALKLSKENVIVKKLSVLQNLGSMNYLFTDKTGTITENNLRVKEVIDQNDLIRSMGVISAGNYERTPMDMVFDKAIEKYLTQKYESQELKLSPFQVGRGYAIYTLADGSEIIRGQYGIVSQVCRNSDSAFCDQCLTAESQGLRIIALACKSVGKSNYELCGAVLFEDPLKPDAVETYQGMKSLGIDVKVITGDSVQVATYVGAILDKSLNGESVYSMDGWTSSNSDDIEKFAIYARCKPEQKSILIDEHLDRGVVGFLGEGINDAMALKRADIGFVVNNASDVARQSGDVILLEKSLSPIIRAIQMSRRAFVHIRTYLLCTLTGNIGTLISLTSVVIIWQQIPMLPIQILLNNLLTDLPLMFLISDTLSEQMVSRPIRDEAKRFFGIIFVFALISSVFDFAFFFLFKQYDIVVLRTGWFVFSVLAELTLVFSLRSELSIFKAPKISKILGVVLVLCYAAAIVLPFVGLGSVFHLVPLTLMQVGILLGVTVVYLVANELVKKVMFKKGA